jgi:hypothetical protein
MTPTINKKTEEELEIKEFNKQYKKMWKMVKSKRNLQDISNKEFIREVEEFIASHK